ncbi:FeoB small GTPase domain-containing protein, partial [Aliarcobacter butzleri]
YEFEVIDLPGTYSLDGYSEEEKITRHFLNQNDYDVIVNVLDATNLERNLILSAELLSLNKKMLLALNMCDEAKKEG